LHLSHSHSPAAPTGSNATTDATAVPALRPQSSFRRLLRDFLIYGAGGVGLQLLGFVSVPVLTRIFTRAEYGVVETIATISLVIGVFAYLGLDSASQRSFFDYSETQEKQRSQVLSTALWTLVISTSFLAGICAVFSPVLADFFFNGRYTVVLALGFAAIPLVSLTTYALEVMRVHHRPRAYAVVAVLGGVASVGSALVLAAVFDYGLKGYYVGLLIGGVASVLLGYTLVRHAVGFHFDRAELETMLRYGVPLIPVSLSMWVLQLADRFFVLHYRSLSELGVYAVGVKLANLLFLAVTGFALAWSPLMLELHKRDPAGERAFRGRVLTYVTFGLCLGAVVLSVFAREFFLTVTSKSYARAYEVVGLSAGAVVALGINSVTMSGISISRRTIHFARYALIAAILNIGLNFVLIPRLGMVGAALATFLSYAALAVLYYARAQTLDPAPFDLRRVLLTVAVAAGVIALGTFVRIDPLWLSVLAKLALVATFLVALRLLGVIDRHGLSLLLRSISKGETAPA
jgi:O-antigen/teichoic acid export membrane protein